MLQLQLESPMIGGEAMARVYDLVFKSAGQNLDESNDDKNLTELVNHYDQIYSQSAYFGFLRNSGKLYTSSLSLSLSLSLCI